MLTVPESDEHRDSFETGYAGALFCASARYRRRWKPMDPPHSEGQRRAVSRRRRGRCSASKPIGLLGSARQYGARTQLLRTRGGGRRGWLERHLEQRGWTVIVASATNSRTSARGNGSRHSRLQVAAFLTGAVPPVHPLSNNIHETGDAYSGPDPTELRAGTSVAQVARTITTHTQGARNRGSAALRADHADRTLNLAGGHRTCHHPPAKTVRHRARGG